MLFRSNDPAVKAWSEAQNAYARSVLDGLPHVDEIRTQVTAILSAQSVSYGGLDVEAGRLFALKRQPPKHRHRPSWPRLSLKPPRSLLQLWSHLLLPSLRLPSLWLPSLSSLKS